MLKFLLKCVLVCSLLLTWAWASDEAIYRVEMTVANESPSARQDAFAQGLERVLIKASGDAKVVTRPGVRAAKLAARAYVETYAYHRANLDEVSDQTLGLSYRLQIRFQPKAIAHLLQTLGYTTWQGQRPTLLVWVVVEDVSLQRHLLTYGTQDTLSVFLKQLMQARGLPMILPVLDLQNMALISPSTVWQEDWSVLNDTAKQYAVNSQLILRLQQQEVQGWRGEAVLVTDSDRFDFIAQASEERTLLRALVNQLSVHMAALNEPQGMKTMQTSLLTISGLTDLNAYVALSTSLRKIPMIRDVELKHFKGDNVEVSVAFQGTLKQLQAAFNNDRRLTVQAEPMPTDSMHLYYHWQAGERPKGEKDE